MGFVRRGPSVEPSSLERAGAEDYEAVATQYAADARFRKAVPSQARALQALVLDRLASEEESRLARDLKPAAAVAHVLAVSEGWSSLDPGRIEALAYACHRGSQTRLWSSSGQAFFLISLTTPSPDPEMVVLRNHLEEQPAWRRLLALDRVRLLAEAGLLSKAASRALALGSTAALWDIETAWTAGMGTGLLQVMGKL